MSYTMYFGEVKLPQCPERVEITCQGNNRTLYLITGEQINLLQSPDLTEIRFTVTLPALQYPWVPSDFLQPSEYLSMFEELLQAQAPFYWAFSRLKPDGTQLFYTSMPVTLERYATVEDAAALGFDVEVEIELKQWRDYGTKVYSAEDGTVTGAVRDTTGSPAADTESTYTVRSGDSLWSIAKKHLGDGSRYTEILALNSDITDPNVLQAGQVLVLPGS